MKMKRQHFEHIKSSVVMPTNATKLERWNALYAANLGQWICDNLYSYLDDTHIDTALRNITQERTK